MSFLVRLSATLTLSATLAYLYISIIRLPPTKTKHRIREILQKVEIQDWKNLRSDFILPVRIFISKNESDSPLKKGWNIVSKSFGSLQPGDTGEPTITPGWILTTIKIPLRFQHAEFALQLQMTSGGSLVGFHFTGLGNGWHMPSYADEERFSESEIVLGKGEFKVGATLTLPHTTKTKTETEIEGLNFNSESELKVPCVTFLSGSGPCDRDSTISENKPFKDLAFGLASQGIASIRFDQVTFTHNKAFRRQKNITLTDEYMDHAIDAISQAQSHPCIDSTRVFILGHSLGAVVTPTLVAKYPSVAGCIIMAGPAEPIYRCYIRQLEYIKSLDGPESVYLDAQIEDARIKAEIADSETLSQSTPARKLPFGIGPEYWLDYRDYRPIETLKGVGCPVLIMQGGRDYQVTPHDDYVKWCAALEGRNGVRFCFYEGLNHIFVFGRGLSTPLEYSLQGNVDEMVVVDIAEWVLGL